MDTDEKGGWRDCCADQQRVAVAQLSAFLVQAKQLLNCYNVALEAYAHDIHALVLFSHVLSLNFEGVTAVPHLQHTHCILCSSKRSYQNLCQGYKPCYINAI